MKQGVCWAVRVSWALLGGAWGVWLGLGGALRLPHNADSFGSLIAMGFFGMFVGLACWWAWRAVR